MKRFIGCLSLLLVGCSATSTDVTAEGSKDAAVIKPAKEVKSITLGAGVSTMAETVLVGFLEAKEYTDPTKAMSLMYTATNSQSHSVSLRFNSGMTADLWLYDPKGQKVWSSSQDMMYTQALRDVTLAPAQTIKTRFSVPVAIMEKVSGPGYRFEVKFAGKVDGSSMPLINANSTPLIVK
ncbi:MULTISPECIES: BsuPI-related putative proteinase inhibitor [Shewanella]|uniref:BsuPI-related putative proteinase inhibitor n=1 Tax=Shewanella TaxID=22 RepID=UPI001BC5221D|nr:MULTISPECIES: BsuPI-related putative proteinase inhibitor [Shewanella]GIU52907.1 proteinase inhibitor [Shewanella sp. KT0246]